MWTCSKCRESVEDSFQVCWSCGTSVDGVEDPNFKPEIDVGVQDTSLEDEFRSRFRCCKCRSTTASVDWIAGTGTGPSRLLNWQIKQFLSVSCGHCGYTEFYNADVLNERSKIGDLLDLIYGR
ncbi:zinc ribbon domain-containing protein [Planctomicrobium piriforme]|uniref:Predicted nucleic-acid-binding protein, contains Zn-ribbon domain n=1 Tax=Planctomicrobium piriforme TaxID=1576369 RepID=A0A1I3B8T3_9PLAN|nr:zinc ribbon domain-containing protein [Planctomicrobium piriforme]SFH58725.1 Predicted nucleic-acid-binding protein, contains Zn-ribbon domain [Planctomicrobium piriforme]